MFLLTIMWLTAALGVTIYPPGATGQPCHIIVGTSPSAEPNQDAIRFQFSKITNNVDFILPFLTVAQHLLSISACVPTLYLLSSAVENPSEQLVGADLSGTMFNCASLSSSAKSLDGTVVKFLRKSLPFDEVIPNSWRSLTDNTILIRLAFRQFPVTNKVSYSCDLRRNVEVPPFTIPVEVKASISLQKVGCTQSRWGMTCASLCPCLNGGECHTFEGHCLCPEFFTGSRCETDLRITTAVKSPTTSTEIPVITSTQISTTTLTNILTSTLATTTSTHMPIQISTYTATKTPTTASSIPPNTSTQIPTTSSTEKSVTSAPTGLASTRQPTSRPTEGVVNPGETSGFPVVFANPYTIVTAMLTCLLAKSRLL